MSCLLSAREDSHIVLVGDCKKMLDDRVAMWEYAAKVSGIKICGFGELTGLHYMDWPDTVGIVA